MALHSLSLSLFLTITLLLTSPPHPSPPHRTLLSSSSISNQSHLPLSPCSPKPNTIITYCTLPITPLSLLILFHFHLLSTTASTHFSPSVTTLCTTLHLSPSMAAVTLLSLGNGAPDLFSSSAALSSLTTPLPTTALASTLSAGAFVSALVVGLVAILAPPFTLSPLSFVRDILFYLMASFLLFYVYLSGEMYFYQAVGFVGFYLFFVGVVFWMDFGKGERVECGRRGSGGGGDVEEQQKGLMAVGSERCHYDGKKGDDGGGNGGGKFSGFGLCYAWKKISQIWEVPVNVILKLTIPQAAPSEWSRFYRSANVALCPLALLYSCRSFMDIDHPIVFLFPQIHLPLWLIVLFSSSSLATLHYIVEKEPPKTEQIHVVLVAFAMSVFWISNVAGELLNCLSALGSLLNVPPALLGLTVLAWGNSVGDLVADVALAKAGQPALAMAGCFAGPMFNMLVGLGTALVVETAKVYPEAYRLHFNINIVIAFVFLFMSLMGSLLVITWSRFRVPRFWGFCLVGLYALFIAVSLVVAKFST